MQSAPVGPEHGAGHLVALGEPTCREPPCERSVFPTQSQHVANGESQAPMLTIEPRLIEGAEVLFGGGGNQRVQRVQRIGERRRPILTGHPIAAIDLASAEPPPKDGGVSTW